jgi:hypothetical protein
MKKYNTNSLIFYNGPSLLDGKPIVGIISNLSLPSGNKKTGAYMAQTYIMRADICPLEAAYHENGDYSVCGNCSFKPSNLNLCYVNIAQAPSNIWKAFNNDRYLTIDRYPLNTIGDRTLRFGAYGDPTAIPFVAWQPLIEKFPKSTGYTHQWESCDRAWQQYLMASCETTSQRDLAKSLGWRTARVTDTSDRIFSGELWCPAQASEQNTVKAHCETCRLCSGGDDKSVSLNSSDRPMTHSSPDIAFVVHGQTKKRFVYA